MHNNWIIQSNQLCTLKTKVCNTLLISKIYKFKYIQSLKNN